MGFYEHFSNIITMSTAKIYDFLKNIN